MSSPSCICPAITPNVSFSEEETLEAMEKFRRFYEDKMKEIDLEGGGDGKELKIKLQERWIKDLTEQTEMMAKIVKELEEEATTRVKMLEDKLKQTSKAAYEVMKRYQTYNITHHLDEPFQKVYYLENDLKNLLEFVRRIRDDRNWCIDGLQFYDVTHGDLFGREQNYDPHAKDTVLLPITDGSETKKETSPTPQKEKPVEFEEILTKKAEEYEALRQSMLDMRSALTEEVACKHDMISVLKKDVQQLEERCLQADKQTAFKDDIIKELRKEIKQLKYQMKKDTEEKKSVEIEELEKKLKKAEERVRKMRPCAELKTACTSTDKVGREQQLEDEICHRQCEVEDLKSKCRELEKALESSQARAENLQKAVDLYLNSINVLEASEERARIEIEQQRVTITNLQEALVNVKQELDEMRQKNQQEVEGLHNLVNVLYVNLLDLEERNGILVVDLSRITESYRKLQDCSFELEVEHFNSLQDLAILETQLHKYQNEFRSFEDSKYATRSEVKKLRQQKRCYEQALECFRNEMAVMSEQLVHLQEILKLSNQSCKEENGQLYKAIVDLQHICDRLQAELIEAEKKIIVENQMNQLKDQKIDELQLIIGQKNADLHVHDEAIREMKKKLENSVMEKHELENKIVSLNSTIMQLQCALASCRDDTCRPKTVEIKRSITTCHDEMDSKNRKLERLQAEYQAQHEVLKTLTQEFEKVKEKERIKTRTLKHQNEILQDKLASSELKNEHLIDELGGLRDEATLLAQKECCREHELAQSKQIILELRQTLIDLNESLAESEFHQKSLAEVFQKKVQEDRQQEDIYLSTRCEIALYKKLVEDFKISFVQVRQNLAEMEAQNKSLHEELLKHRDKSRKSLAETEDQNITLHKELMKQKDKFRKTLAELEGQNKSLHDELMKQKDKFRKNLADIEVQNKSLHEELKHKDNMLNDIHRKFARKEKETYQHIKELTEKLQQSQNEEKRLSGFIDNLKAEIHKRIAQNHECHDFLTGCCRCESDSEMASTQEEINALKIEIKRMIQNQLSLNNENDKLLKQVTTLQTAVTNLEEKNCHLRHKLEKAQSENHKLKETNKLLHHEKETYNQTIKNLEVELTEARNYRDDICAESKHVMNNVKAWLEEQKKINDKMKKRTQGYCDTIMKLRQENANLMNRPCLPPIKNNKPLGGVNPLIAQAPPTPIECQSPWCLGSQGMDSPRDSPSSFLTCSVEEWYSPNYRDETDFETDHEDEFINRLEAVTLEMRSNNKKWKQKCRPDCECRVSKDDK